MTLCERWGYLFTLPISFLKKYLFLIIYKYTVPVFRQTRRGYQIPYRWLWATMWLLGIKLWTSGRAVSALNRWAISAAKRAFYYLLLVFSIDLWVCSLVKRLQNRLCVPIFKEVPGLSDRVMASFIPTWNKLETSQRQESQWRVCLQKIGLKASL